MRSHFPNIILLLGIAVLPVTFLGCSAGQSESIEGVVEPKGLDQAAAAQKGVQEPTLQPSEQKKDCTFSYRSAQAAASTSLVGDTRLNLEGSNDEGSEKVLSWEAKDETSCLSVCEQEKPPLVAGICAFKGSPLGVSVRQEEVVGGRESGSNPLELPNNVDEVNQLQSAMGMLSASQGCVMIETAQGSGMLNKRQIAADDAFLCQAHCEGSGISDSSSEGVCGFDGVVLAQFTSAANDKSQGGTDPGMTDNSTDVGLCRLETVDANNMPGVEASNMTRGECSQLCAEKALGDVSLTCFFNDQDFFSKSLTQPPASQEPGSCQVEVRDGLSGQTSRFIETLPGIDECVLLCESKIAEGVLGLVCSFKGDPPYVSVDFGPAIDPVGQKLCTTVTEFEGSRSERSQTTTQVGCQQECLVLLETPLDSISCMFATP